MHRGRDADELKQTGEELAEHLNAPAGEAVEQVKGTAAERAQAVADTASDAASEETARDAADTAPLRGDR